jgi:hypothetical protein
MKLRFVEFSKKWNAETKKLVTAGSVYVIDGITKEELALYKGIKNVDGEDYYREENGKPKWFDREFYGFDCCEVKLFERADGTKGFKVVNTMVDALQVLAEQTDDATEKARLLRESNMIKLSGKPYKATAVQADAVEGIEEPEDETEGAKFP